MVATCSDIAMADEEGWVVSGGCVSVEWWASGGLVAGAWWMIGGGYLMVGAWVDGRGGTAWKRNYSLAHAHTHTRPHTHTHT